MTEIKISISAPEIVDAINNLATALKEKTVNIENQGTLNFEIPATAEQVFSAPAQPVVAVNTVPVAPVTPVPTAVPTAMPQYTLDDLAKAGTALVDAGKMNELLALLTKFGVDALTNLNPSQYGAMATELRNLGAQI